MNVAIKELPPNLKKELKALALIGREEWSTICLIEDNDINQILIKYKLSKRNLYFLKSIAVLITELHISVAEASIIVHSGISSVSALRQITPEELLRRTNRLERIMGTNRNSIIDVARSSKLIKLAQQSEDVRTKEMY